MSVTVGRSEGGVQMWGSGNAYIIHKFGKLGYGAEAQGVVSAEKDASSGDGFPIQWTVAVTKCLAGRDEEVFTDDESLGAEDIWVILGLPESTGGIVLGRVAFLVGKGETQVINADKVRLPCTGKGDNGFLGQVNETVVRDHGLRWHKTGNEDKSVLFVALDDEPLGCEHEIGDEGGYP